jgi:hypothetical protein
MGPAHTIYSKAIDKGRRLSGWPLFRSSAVAIAIGLACYAPAQALIVGNVPNVVPQTTVNPADYLGWQQGDPGWDNVVAQGSNYVYLGDGWVISARHVGYNAANGVTFQTMLPNGSPGPVETFYRIPGSHYFDYGYQQGSTRYYAVNNPTTIQSETGQAISLMDSNGTFFTDLQLFRINGDPGLPPLTIASQPLPQNFTRSNAPEVVMIGRGESRQANERRWDVVKNSTEDWAWSSATGDGDYQGYVRDGVVVKRWGTNRLTDPRPNFGGDPSDPGAVNYTTQNEPFLNPLFNPNDVVSDTTVVYALETGSDTRDVISLMTVYDDDAAPGQTELEFQGISGNSGSGVFHKRGDQWELVGIVNAVWRYPDQAGLRTVYGNATLISDLSYYNQDYFNSIKYIIDSHPDYSHLGDLNLDGAVSGDGSGPPGSDDVTDFIRGWGYNNGTGLGTITSWKNGDLNHDGRTNVNDFLMLRSALNGQISSAVVEVLFGDASFDPDNGIVPEPATALLASMAAAFLALVARRRPDAFVP